MCLCRIGTRREEPFALPVDRANDATASGNSTGTSTAFQRFPTTTTNTRTTVTRRWRRRRDGNAILFVLREDVGEDVREDADRPQDHGDTDRPVNSDARSSPWRTDARTMLILPDIKLQVNHGATHRDTRTPLIVYVDASGSSFDELKRSIILTRLQEMLRRRVEDLRCLSDGSATSFRCHRHLE